MEKINIFDKIFRIFLIGSLFLLFALSFALAQEQNQKTLTYENEEYGVKITGPNGWYVFRPKNKSKFSIQVMFSRYPVGSTEEDNPKIVLETEPVTQESGKTPLEHANYYVGVLKYMKDMGDIKELIIREEPALVNINNREGTRYVYETKILRKNREDNLRDLEYVFIKGDLYYRLDFSSKAEYFDKHKKEFEEALNTFVLK